MFVKQWEDKTTKLNFFSKYLVQNNQETHCSFKNGEKQWEQALICCCIQVVAVMVSVWHGFSAVTKAFMMVSDCWPFVILSTADQQSLVVASSLVSLVLWGF